MIREKSSFAKIHEGASPALRQGGRFIAVGVGNTLLCLGLTWILQRGTGMSIWLSSAIGYCLAAVQSYLLNRNWTFRNSAKAGVRLQLFRFIVVNALSAFVYSTLNAFLATSLPLVAAIFASLVITTVLSFVLMRTFVFPVQAP